MLSIAACMTDWPGSACSVRRFPLASIKVPGILADCGGCCSCATCHCYVEEPWGGLFPTASVEEAELVSYAFDPRPTSRLSCQLVLTSAHDGIEIGLPKRQI